MSFLSLRVVFFFWGLFFVGGFLSFWCLGLGGFLGFFWGGVCLFFFFFFFFWFFSFLFFFFFFVFGFFFLCPFFFGVLLLFLFFFFFLFGLFFWGGLGVFGVSPFLVLFWFGYSDHLDRVDLYLYVLSFFPC